MLKQSPEKPVRDRIDLSTKEQARHWWEELESAMAKVRDKRRNCYERTRQVSRSSRFDPMATAMDGQNVTSAAQPTLQPELADSFEHFHAVAFGVLQDDEFQKSEACGVQGWQDRKTTCHP
jgi:hypothetical protein